MLKAEQVRKKCITFITDSKDATSLKSQKERAQLYQDFFRGGTHQWTEEEYNIYKSKGVEPVSINRSKPVVKGLLGMYLQNRQDIKVLPRKNGTQTVAKVCTEILKHTQDASYADYVYAATFLRGCIDTEAYLKLEIDKAENINGQPKIFCKSLSEIVTDRNAKEYDMNESAKFVIEKLWMDKDEIKALYPEMEEDIDTVILEDDTIEKRMANNMAGWMSNESGVNYYDEDEELADSELLNKYRYLMHKCYWKEIVPGLIVGDKQESRVTIVTDEKKIAKLRRKAEKSERFTITNHAARILHETVILGNRMLDDIINPYGEGISDFPIVRFAPMWDEGFAVGALDDVVGLNKEENIHRTQSIRLLNQTANSGWIVGDDGNKSYIGLLKDYGSVEGIILPKNKFGGYLEKIQPNIPAQGQLAAGAQFEMDVKRVSGVDDATHGYNIGRAESGVAIGRKQQQNRITNDPFFYNLYRTLEIFGNFLLQVNIRSNYYTDDEIRDIVGQSGLLDVKMIEKAKANLIRQLGGVDLPEPMPLPPMDPAIMKLVRPQDKPVVLQTVRDGIEAAQKYQKAYPGLKASWDEVIEQEAIEMLLKKLKDDKNGKYGVKVTVSKSAPTERLARLAEMDTLQEKYGIIPPDIFLDATDLPNKEEIKARMQQAQQARMQQMQQAQLAQMQTKGVA